MAQADDARPSGNGNSNGTIAIVGCGLIGQAWAIVFLRAGYDVSLFDPVAGVADKALAAIVERLHELVASGMLDKGGIPAMTQKLGVASCLATAVSDALHVQESGPENLQVKAALTAEIDRVAAPGTSIGSSTSGILTSHYARDVAGRMRCLVVHPINPPHLVPAVEIAPAPFTDKAVTDRVIALMQTCNQTPVVLDKEIDGFVVNRLQGALLAEAFRLLNDGVASAEDIDKAIKDGLAPRWSIMGPFETIHLNAPGGVAQYVERYGPMYKDMFASQSELPDWSALVRGGLEDALCEKHPLASLAHSHKERDRALAALMMHRAADAGEAG